jgi:hypothetical protein
MRGLGGTGLLDRNRPTLERALRLRARNAAAAKRGREAVLAHAKRVERSSAFVPHGSDGDAACAPVLYLPRCVHAPLTCLVPLQQCAVEPCHQRLQCSAESH